MAAIAHPPPMRSALPTESQERALTARYRPRPLIYWGDLLGCVALGWPAFAFAVAFWGSAGAWLALALAVLALYRAVLFIHELSHLASGAVRGLHLAWDLLAGFPLLAPSLMYVGSHGEHHKASIYGTPEDPEYAPLVQWGPWRLLAATLGLLLVPPALIVRWGLLVPIGWIVPAVRELAVGRLSTLAINPSYVRKPPKGKLKRRWQREELACMAVVWLAGGALTLGALPMRALWLWFALVAAILMINHARTLGAHGYTNENGAMPLEAQVADSVNLWGPAWLRPLTALAAPVGLRFHALHHYFPTLPYHSLGEVHRQLTRELPESSPYRAGEQPSLASALLALARRVR